MFTGLVETVGQIERVFPFSGGRRLRIRAPGLKGGVSIRDSISVSGVCLTITQVHDESFEVEVVPETLTRTTLGRKGPGDRVNLERALRLGDRLGGHLVQGHVDGTGHLLEIRPIGEGRWMTIRVSEALSKYLVEKGAIAVDGISLTVARMEKDRIGIAVVPYTWTHTTLSLCRHGDRVNIEVDLVGKYIARLLKEKRLLLSDSLPTFGYPSEYPG